MTMTLPLAEKLARGRVEAWNAHDLPRVLAHYGDEATGHSISP